MILLFALCVLQTSAQAAADLVTNLPGLTFQTNFKTYSGYVNANDNGTWKMHYMLTESQSDPKNDPLMLWITGGPGFSSVGSLFKELGPFYVNQDGKTLFENVYAFNKKANILYLESPIGVGFSYDTEDPLTTVISDDRAAQQNYHAISDFFNRVQPRYLNRTFFLAGDSFAGLYLPMLSKLMIEGINNGTFPNLNFQGVAIGNGFFDIQKLYNSRVIVSAYNGRISPGDWARVKKVCRTGNETDFEKYNYIQFMTTKNGLQYTPEKTECGKLIKPLVSNDLPYFDKVDAHNYFYNVNQGCYHMATGDTKGKKRRSIGKYQSSNRNTANLFNYDSTDNQWGYPCWNSKAVTSFLNRKDVQEALHIEPAWAAQSSTGTIWEDSNMPLFHAYHNKYSTSRPFFDSIIANVKIPGFRFLIYNGDNDPMITYLGNDWFFQELGVAHKSQEGPRKPWLFAQEMAGRWQRYNFSSLHIDFLTVRGAGHNVPLDRPGPALQMFTNFMFPSVNGSDYSSEENIKPQPIVSPLLQHSDPSGTLDEKLQMLTNDKKHK